MHMSENEINFYINLIKNNKIKFVIALNRLEKKREGETEFNKIFTENKINLIEKIGLGDVLQGMHLTFYENNN